MSHRDATSVDIGLERSVSFAPPAPLLAADSGFNHAHLDTSAGPRRSAFGAPSLVRRGELEAVHQYPIQSSKVQRPPLHDETLARERLLDWLNVKVHHRIVFVVAEAAYGKTTLLSDFSRRSRLRTLWYRLDEEDRNWIAFLNYLVAAGRELDPGFAPATAGLLREMDGPGPTREAVPET